MHYAESLLFDGEGLASRMPTRNLIEQIARIQPDIVHLHNIHDHWLNYRILFEYLNRTDIKVIWTFHDFWAVTGHCMHFVSCGCDRYVTGCHDCPMQKVYPKSLADRSASNYDLKKNLFSANRHLTVVPVSEWVAENVRKSFLKDKNIVVIPNGIDTTLFKPTSIESLSDGKFKETIESLERKFLILSVASQWKFDKGLEDYIAISKMLKNDEVIVLVGVDGSIIKMLPYNIVGIRRTADVLELAALYTRADVVTVLSSAETFGLTIIEGYACGTPAIVYDNTAPPSLITAETGRVVPDKDHEAVYRAITDIKAKGKVSFSEACIKLARERYDKDVCYGKYVELYDRLM